ncbi:MAG TPA: type I restriction-modification enzyme R subunit C-terminal domain-containing protein [Bryobacteraceae bacterium]|nr:type I restriction-modification enzyme R subunit C-terminal domain-containing protein [Bryobacteraceae bacterium]
MTIPATGKPEDRARANIDRLLTAAGWVIQNRNSINIEAGRGVAIREFQLAPGHGFADYLLYVDGYAAGVVEAKKEGVPLIGVEIQTAKYSEGLPQNLPAPRRPLPFLYESTGVETRFTNLLEPDARSRPVFGFHRPETLAAWLEADLKSPGSSLRGRLRIMPSLPREGLWDHQYRVIANLEQSLARNDPRALIHMTMGSGKTFTACNFVYRLIAHAGARRVVFLVDRRTLGRQALNEFQQFSIPGDGRKFTEIYNVQLLSSNAIDPVCRVAITTIQRLYSILKGEPDYDPGNEETSAASLAQLRKAPDPIEYNRAVPIETFDFIVTDECHRSIYNLWRQVLEYFDSFIIGLTATPSKNTLGFFNQNVMPPYTYSDAVAEGVNVGYDVYKIDTRISSAGSRVESGYWVDKRDRLTRARRAELLDTDFSYTSDDLNRDVVAPDQIRTVIREFRDKLFSDIFPGRTEVPKTLIFARDDSHADDIVQIVREEFGKGNDFCQKITYRTGKVRVSKQVKREDGTEEKVVEWVDAGEKADGVLSFFRTTYNPRIVVTVDMIATGTDVRPLEILFFMRDVRSLNYFEQMKGRGVRVLNSDELRSVTPDATTKDRFVIVDAVGVTDHPQIESRPLERQPHVPLHKLLEAVALGSTDKDVVSSLASRLARLDRRVSKAESDAIRDAAHGVELTAIVHGLLDALDPDLHEDLARQETGLADPPPEAITSAASRAIAEAIKPLKTNPALRQTIAAVQKSHEQVVDIVSKDEVTLSEYSQDAKDKAAKMTKEFEQYLIEHRDEIEALQILYSRPYRFRLSYKQVRDLAEAIRKPHPAWTTETLWRAYETLDRSRVRASNERVFTNIVSLVRFALSKEGQLEPFPESVRQRFANWIAEQQANGSNFSDEQIQWLTAIAEHVGTSIEITPDDLESLPFSQKGGLGRAYQLFGDRLQPLLDELNEVLVQ